MERSKYYIPGSNAGMIVSGKLYGTCPKITYLRNARLQTKIDFRARCTFGLGNAAEEILIEELESKGVKVLKDLSDRRGTPVKVSEEVDYFWEKDIVFPNGQFIELKSVSSLNTYKRVFADNTPKYDNVLQAATYLMFSETEKCSLTYLNFLYTSFTKNKVKYKASAGDTKKFILSFADTGALKIDNKLTPISQDGIVRYLEYVGHILETKEWDHEAPEPLDGLMLKDPKACSPCVFCDFREACEGAESFDEFERMVESMPNVERRESRSSANKNSEG